VQLENLISIGILSLTKAGLVNTVINYSIVGNKAITAELSVVKSCLLVQLYISNNLSVVCLVTLGSSLVVSLVQSTLN
jgi:hypothetical protein